jgi:hypothetical protein
MMIKMENKKNVIFSFNFFGIGFTVFKNTPDEEKKTPERKPRGFQYF